MLAVDAVFELINCVIIDYCREIKTLFYDNVVKSKKCKNGKLINCVAQICNLKFKINFMES